MSTEFPITAFLYSGFAKTLYYPFFDIIVPVFVQSSNFFFTKYFLFHVFVQWIIRAVFNWVPKVIEYFRWLLFWFYYGLWLAEYSNWQVIGLVLVLPYSFENLSISWVLISLSRLMKSTIYCHQCHQVPSGKGFNIYGETTVSGHRNWPVFSLSIRMNQFAIKSTLSYLS